MRRRFRGHGRQAGPGAVEVDDDRPVPQVDAVGDGADEVQWPPGQCRGRTDPGRPAVRRRRPARASAAQRRNPPSNMKLVGSPPDVPAVTQNTARTTAAAGPTQCRVRRARARRLRARRDQEGQGGAGHEIEETGVGAVVDARRIDAGVEQDGHQHRGPDAEDDGDGHARPGASPGARSEGARGGASGHTR